MLVALCIRQSEGTCPVNKSTNYEVAPQPAVGSGWEAVHLNPPDEKNQMVYGPKRWHPCSCQVVKVSDSSPARCRPRLGSGVLESAGQDELVYGLNRLHTGTCSSLQQSILRYIFGEQMC